VVIDVDDCPQLIKFASVSLIAIYGRFYDLLRIAPDRLNLDRRNG